MITLFCIDLILFYFLNREFIDKHQNRTRRTNGALKKQRYKGARYDGNPIKPKQNSIKPEKTLLSGQHLVQQKTEPKSPMTLTTNITDSKGETPLLQSLQQTPKKPQPLPPNTKPLMFV